jgi:hypothetical protein
MRVGKEVCRGYVTEDFQEAISRYVPVADFQARVDELGRRAELQKEAKIEAEKEAALIERVMAAAPRDRAMGVQETMALITQLEEEEREKAV